MTAFSFLHKTWIGFNKNRLGEGIERLFEVHYEIQNGEECESKEQLTFAQVQQGRSWFKVFNKDRMKKDRDRQRFAQMENTHNDMKEYESMLQEAGTEQEQVHTVNVTPTSEGRVNNRSCSMTTTIGSSSSSSSSITTVKRLDKWTIDEVSSQLRTINMSDELISTFVELQVDGVTLSVITSSEELSNDFLGNVKMSAAKFKVLWTSIMRWREQPSDC